MSRSRDIADAGGKVNYLDNVTANIPADVASTYAPLASPTFTGTTDISSGATFPAGHVIQSKYASSASATIVVTAATWATYQATLDITSPTAGNELFLSACTGGYNNEEDWCYMGIMIDDSVNDEQVIIGADPGIRTVAAYFNLTSSNAPHSGSFPGGGGTAFGKYTIPSGSGTITCRLNLFVNGGTWTVQGSHLIVQEIQT